MTTQDFWIVGGIALGCIVIAGWCLSRLIDTDDSVDEESRKFEALAESRWAEFHKSKY